MRVGQTLNRGGVGGDIAGRVMETQGPKINWPELSPQDKAHYTTALAPFSGNPVNVNDPFKGGTSGNVMDFLNRAMMSEGLSYMGERAIDPASSPLMKGLASKLGVSPGASTVKQSPLLQDVLDSLNQLRQNSQAGGSY